MALNTKIEAMYKDMLNWRHHLHAHPETAFAEENTSRFIAEKLESFGMKVTCGLGKTGVVATLDRGGGAAIGLRSEMDALDIQEESDLDYRSTTEGKMHACGHDGHMAMLLGAAKYLSENDSFRGTVHFIFQPAEENEGGARVMMEDGLFRKFPVSAVYGMHNFPWFPLGTFAIRPGPIMAAFDIFEITVNGTGAHAAMPFLGKDSVLAAAQMITMFQSIVSRNISALESAVISVTQVNGGTAYNVMPDRVALKGTTRTFQEYVQFIVETRMKEITNGVASAMGMTAEIKYEKRYPATVNTPAETEKAVNAAVLIAGNDNVNATMSPIMGSEDFGLMLKEVPGAYIAIGAGVPRERGMLHQPCYNFNDELLVTGTSYWASLVETLLPKIK